MGDRRRVIFSALVMWVLVNGCVAAWAHGLGARPGTPEEQAYVRAVYTEVRAVQANELARARVEEERRRSSSAQMTLTATRPSAVDNSVLPWFPPIGDQGEQNSCVGWSVGYYYNTYTQARDEGVDVSRGDPTHTCSPAFLYPLLNDGVDEGAYLEAGVAKLSVIGCGSLALTPYKESDYTTWPSEAAWVDGLSRRTINAHWIAGNTDAGLQATRQLLANGGLGVVFVDMYANLHYDYPGGPGVGNGVLYAPAGPYLGGHSVTLVGYDDTRTYRDERDGRTHTGAFLLVNSWGSSWGVANSTGASKGFLWIAYDAFRERHFVYDPVYTDDRPKYRPRVYALVGISHRQRGYLTLAGGSGLPSAPDAVTSLVLDHSGGTKLPVDCSGRIAVDLTEVANSLPAGRVADLFLTLGVSSQAASQAAIAEASFYADLDGDRIYSRSSAPYIPVTVAAGNTGCAFLPLFADLNWDNWAYKDIEACFEAGVVSGYPDASYHPRSAVTRDQMAVYTSRAMAGGDDAVPTGPLAPAFPDVRPDHWAYRYVEYAKAQDVVQGYPDGYRPAVTVDRAQMAVYIARSVATPTGEAGLVSYVPPGTPSFADVPADYWAYRHIEYCKACGIVQGYADGYHPRNVVTRDQMAVYVARAFGLAG